MYTDGLSDFALMQQHWQELQKTAARDRLARSSARAGASAPYAWVLRRLRSHLQAWQHKHRNPILRNEFGTKRRRHGRVAFVKDGLVQMVSRFQKREA